MTDKTKPRLSILDPRFRYRSAANTDVRLTFRRARALATLAEKPAKRTEAAVVPMKRAKGGG